MGDLGSEEAFSIKQVIVRGTITASINGHVAEVLYL